MSDRESYERVYTLFHENGPITLTEHELCNEYMRLREALAVLADPLSRFSFRGRVDTEDLTEIGGIRAYATAALAAIPKPEEGV